MTHATDARAALDAVDGIVDDTHPEGDGCPLCTALDDLRLAVDALIVENEELGGLFDLQWKRMGEATEAWRKAHPGNDLVQPDLGKLLEWLLSERLSPDVPLDRVLADLRSEVGRAREKHAPMNSPHEGWAVIREELEPELWDHVVHDTGRSPEARAEALQVAAMGVRYVLDLIDDPQ